MTQKIRDAYDQTAFDVVETSAGVEIPTSTPAVFNYDDECSVTTASGAQQLVERGDFALIAPHPQDGDGRSFHLSSKVYISDTNEFAHLKMTSQHVRVFPKDNEFSRESLRALVEHLESELGVELVLVKQGTETGTET